MFTYLYILKYSQGNLNLEMRKTIQPPDKSTVALCFERARYGRFQLDPVSHSEGTTIQFPHPQLYMVLFHFQIAFQRQ